MPEKRADRWTILVCPRCGEQVMRSALDVSRGFAPMCGCTSFVAKNVHGVASAQGGTVPLAVVVVPEDPDWRGTS